MTSFSRETPAVPGTMGETSEQYASTLLTALVRAGAPGRVLLRHHQPGRDSDGGVDYHRWASVQLHLRGHAIRVFCVPTGCGVVLYVESEPGGLCKCLPTYGAPAAAFGAATLAVARQDAIAADAGQVRR